MITITVKVLQEKGEKTRELLKGDIRVAGETTVAEVKVLASEKFLEADKYSKVKDEVTYIQGTLEDTAAVGEYRNVVYRLYVSEKPTI